MIVVLLFIQGIANNIMISTKVLLRLFILVDTSPKLTVNETFIWHQDVIWDNVFKNGPIKICGTQPLKNLRDMVCLSRFFKGCLPQILLDPFLNTLSHMIVLLTFSFVVCPLGRYPEEIS